MALNLDRQFKARSLAAIGRHSLSTQTIKQHASIVEGLQLVSRENTAIHVRHEQSCTYVLHETLV